MEIQHLSMQSGLSVRLRHLRPSWWGLSTFLAAIFCCSAVLFAACGGSTGAVTPQATASPPRVNGFGTAANHSHSMLAFPNGALVLATHYGIFRSPDSGKSWKMVAAGPNQLMEGLMTFSLVSSPLNPQRLYVLTQRVYNQPKGTLGLYTSLDQGSTWKLGATTADLGDMYLAAPGNETPDEVYIYLNRLGALGLKVSVDGGQHFSVTGTLPFGRLQGLLAIPGAPGQLLAYGNDGVARSTDGGTHWQLLPGISGAVFNMATAGAGSPIYASGDAGISVSHDGGKSFELVYTRSSYNSLAVSPTQPQELYGKIGAGVFQSTDGGQSWNALPTIKKNLQNLVVDPANASQVYLSTDYPTEVYRFDQSGAVWSTLTPHS